MNSQFLKQHWTHIRSQLKSLYPVLTENDLAYVLDREGEIFECASRRTGLSRQQLEQSLFEQLTLAA